MSDYSMDIDVETELFRFIENESNLNDIILDDDIKLFDEKDNSFNLTDYISNDEIGTDELDHDVDMNPFVDETNSFNLTDYIPNDDIRADELDHQLYINNFDETLLDNEANNQSEEIKLEEIIAPLQYEWNESNCLVQTNPGDFYAHQMPNQVSEMEVQSSTMHLILPAAMEAASISSEIRTRRGRGRPRKAIDVAIREAQACAGDDLEHRRKKNNISSIKYRRNRGDAQIQLEANLNSEESRNKSLLRKINRNDEKIHKLRALTGSLGITLEWTNL